MDNQSQPIKRKSRQSRRSGRLSRSLSKAFQTLRRSSSVVKDIPRTIINQQTQKITSEQVWIQDEEGNWILYNVIHQEHSDLIVADIKTKKETQINLAFKDVFPSNSIVVSDMTFMRSLNEPTIIYNLRERYLNKFTYTSMGTILIATNPFEWYISPSVDQFVGRKNDPENPHPFGIAESSYQQICLNNPINQSIVISGESGSGKTETAKMILTYVVERVSAKYIVPLDMVGDGIESGHSEMIEKRLLLTSPVLEAFGNAQTSRNNNSSRFGKYVKIHFVPFGGKSRTISGASIETYLLEKSRITGQSKGERNFHIFYHFLSAAGKRTLLSSCNLIVGLQDPFLENINLSSTSPNDFSILGSGKPTNQRYNPRQFPFEAKSPDSVSALGSDLELFRQVASALEELGLSKESVLSIWKILGAILELGNINFYDIDVPTGVASQISETTLKHATFASSLLEVPLEQLTSILLTRQMKTGREVFTIPLNSRESSQGRNAFLKTLYANLFNDIITAMNRSLLSRDTAVSNISKTISVLDIFGFESFDRNDFEQLLINYANEALQCAFNEQVFLNDLKLFQEQSIEINLSPEDCPSNHHCVHLISCPNKSSPSILSILQSVAQLPTGTDESFCENLHATLGRSRDPNVKKYFLAVHPKDRNQQFAVKHYAGRVIYTVSSKEVNNWINKNFDSTPEGFSNLLSFSSNPFIQSMNLSEKSSSDSRINSKRNVNEKKMTVSDRFVLSMNDLCQALKSSSCSFIKCIKPNKQLKPLLYDDSYVIEQVRSLGLVQVCEVMKVGLPLRVAFQDIFAKFQIVYQEVRTLYQEMNDILFISLLMFAFEVPPHTYRLGKTVLFFTSDGYEIVDAIMNTDCNVQQVQQLIEKFDEGVRIRKGTQELVDSFQVKLNELDSRILHIKDDTNQFNQTMSEITTQMESLQSQTFSTKSQVALIADSLPNTQKSVQDVEQSLVKFKEFDRDDPHESLTLSFSTVLSQFHDIEKIWTTINEKITVVDDTYMNRQWDEIHSMSSKACQILSEIDGIMPPVRYLINKTVTRSERAPILKVESWTQDCEYNISLINSQLDRTVELIDTGKEMTNKMFESLGNLNLVIAEIITHSHSIQLTGDRIEEQCIALKQQIVDLQTSILLEREAKLLKQLAEQEEQKRREAAHLEAQLAEIERQKIEEAQLQTHLEEENRKVNTLSVTYEPELIPQSQDELTSSDTLEQNENQFENHESDDEYDFEEEEDLPLGWEKVYDSQSKSYLYKSLLTNETQSDRPLSPAKTREVDDSSILLLSADSEDASPQLDTSEVHQIDNPPKERRGAKRLSFISIATTEALLDESIHDNASVCTEDVPVPELGEHERSVWIHQNTSTDKKSTLNRLFSIVREEYVSQNELETVVRVYKKGTLYKQGKLFGVWKRIFVVLDGDVLEQYKTAQAYLSGSPASKQMQLTGRSVLSYTKYSQCFTVHTDSTSWVLMTESESEFTEWMNGLNAVITALFHERIERIRRSKYR